MLDQGALFVPNQLFKLDRRVNAVMVVIIMGRLNVDLNRSL